MKKQSPRKKKPAKVRKRRLTLKQKRAADGLLQGKSKLQAARDAGYTESVAHVATDRIFDKPEVKAYIARRLEDEELSSARVLEELRRIAFVKIQDLFDAAGNLKQAGNLGEAGSCVAAMEVIEKNLKSGDGLVDTIHKVKLWDKNRALETLAKHFGLLIEKTEHSGELQIRWQTAEEAKGT